MAYTIKGLARANECESLDENGLAQAWFYWFVCNYGGRKTIIADFKRLRKAERMKMLGFLRSEFSQIYDYIVSHIY